MKKRRSRETGLQGERKRQAARGAKRERVMTKEREGDWEKGGGGGQSVSQGISQPRLLGYLGRLRDSQDSEISVQDPGRSLQIHAGQHPGASGTGRISGLEGAGGASDARATTPLGSP